MNPIAVKRSFLPKATTIVPYLTVEEVDRICQAVKPNRNGERDSLLVNILFQTGLRISECISITPRKVGSYNGHSVLNIIGKGNKPRMVACPDRLADKIRSYCYTKNIGIDERIFKINRIRAWKIVKEAGKKARINKEIYPHLFRHSDAIERLRQTGNPKALQIHLGHSSIAMTMRYLSTLTAEEAVKIEQGVEFER